MDLNHFDQKCLELLEAAPNRQSRHCFRSAVNHLQRALKLFEVDSVMATFRCYTAEEEAASGLMHCLKERNYANANLLKPDRHLQKNAFIPFFGVLAQFVEDNLKDLGTEIDLCLVDEHGKTRVTLEVQMTSVNPPLTLAPDPPLNFSLEHEGKRFSYRKQIDYLAETRGANKVLDYLHAEGNKRNLLLYASPTGFPSEISVTPKFFPAFQNRVMAMLRVYLMIQPYNERQPFVQDCLDAFLGMLNSLKLDDLHETV